MNGTNEICEAAKSLGCSVKINEELKNHTTFKIGGRCDALIGLQGEKSCRKLIPLAEKLNVPYYIFGKGSNLIVDSDGISGIVFQFGKGNAEMTWDTRYSRGRGFHECGSLRRRDETGNTNRPCYGQKNRRGKGLQRKRV